MNTHTHTQSALCLYTQVHLRSIAHTNCDYRERESSGMMARIVRVYGLLKNDLFYQFNLNSFLLVPVRTFENYKRIERALSEFYSNFKMRGAGGSLAAIL